MTVTNAFLAGRSNSSEGLRDCILLDELEHTIGVTGCVHFNEIQNKVIWANFRNREFSFEEDMVFDLAESPRGIQGSTYPVNSPSFYTAAGNAVKMTMTGSDSGSGWFHTFTEYNLPVKFVPDQYDTHPVVASVDIPVPGNTLYQGGASAGEERITSGMTINEGTDNAFYIKPYFDINMYRLSMDSSFSVSSMASTYQTFNPSGSADFYSFFYLNQGKDVVAFFGQGEGTWYTLPSPYSVSTTTTNQWTFKSYIRNNQGFTNSLDWLPNSIKLKEYADQIDVMMIGTDYNDNNRRFARRYTLIK